MSEPSISPTMPTAADVEAQRKSSHFTHVRLLWDQAAVTPETLAHKYEGDGTSESPYLVEYLPGDPRNAMAWSNTKKWTIVLTQAIATLAVSFTAAAYAGGATEVAKEFQAPSTVVVLGVSLFVLGFAIGPLLWAPFSELHGRQRLFFLTYMVLTVFNAGAAGANSMTTLAVLRFFAGAFGSSPLTNAGGVIADLFDASERGIAISIFSVAPFLGPAIGPIAGGFLGEAAGWRWIEGLMAIFTGIFWIIGTFVCPETYAPVLLRRRAEALSKQTGKVYISKLDAGQPVKTLSGQLKIALSRPWILLFTEPIVLVISIYTAIVYGTLFMCFAAFPIVYQQQRGWSPGVGGLAFTGIAIGMTVSTVGSIFDNKRYKRVVNKNGGNASPEARLPPAILGSVLLPLGQFWFAWSNGKDVHWAVSIVGTGVFATGIVLVMLSLFNYLIDSYVIYAASVLAANAVLRSLFAAAFPLFTTYMYRNLGIHWASSVPAFLALACMPFPFLFYKYGEKIRMKCKYAAEAAKVLEKMRAMQQQPTSEDEIEAPKDKTDGDDTGRHLSMVDTRESNNLPV